MASLLAKACVGGVLLAALAAAVLAPAPRRAPSGAAVRAVLVGAFALYAAGVLGAVEHSGRLAVAATGLGVAVSALAAWLSRGGDESDEPPRGGDDGAPAPEPAGLDGLDWARFDRARRGWERPRERSPR